MMEDVEIVVVQSKKQKLPPPPSDGELHVTVHIISVNAQASAFSKSKRNTTFVVTDCAKYLMNHNSEDPTKNTQLPRIDASIIHEMVISHFGALAKTVK